MSTSEKTYSENGFDPMHHDEKDVRQLVCSFEIGGQWLGLPVGDVIEIQTSPNILSVTGAPAYLAGLVNVRGEILSVLDIGVFLGSPNRRRSGFLALVSWRGQNCCLLIGDPGEVEAIPQDALEAMPPDAGAGLRLLGRGFWPGFPTGLVLLNVEVLFQPRFRELVSLYEAGKLD